MKADLHMHSTYSDGTKSVAELVERAREKGLTHIALTDHDSMQGVEEITAIASNYNIKVIKGIELSTYNLGESVHLLGYFLGEPGEEVLNFSNNQLTSRRQRAVDMANLVIKHFDLKMNIDRLMDNEGMITRSHIGKELVLSNPTITIEEAFTKYLGDDSKAYIKSSKMSTLDGVEFLKRNHGIVIVAHPTLMKVNHIEDIIKLGIDGIEGYYPKNSLNQHLEYLDYAEKYNLMITAGSDYHGVIDYSHEDMGTCYLTEKLFERY